MVKANAYGHDALWVSRTLLQQAALRKSIRALGVASVSEALELRRGLPTVFKAFPIIIFSDCAPWNESWIRLCVKEHLEPVFSDLKTLLQFQQWALSQKGKVVPRFHVEVNTGMNRLGIPAESLPLLAIQPDSVFTHLAESENPHSPLTLRQMKRFEFVIQWRNRNFPEVSLHFANSGAIWNAAHFESHDPMDWVRPGLSLYGIRPFRSAKNEGLKSVMTFEAPVIQKIFLQPGEQIGYGGTYRCRSKKGEWVATLGSGYGDGVFRSLANRDPILGKVSMDLITVKSTARVRVGDWVTLWGEGIDPYNVSDRAGTIPYEITTRIGMRVEKLYE